MKLLENVYYDNVADSLREMSAYSQGLIDYQLFNERIRPLTTDEKVDFLYEKALNGSASEYRQICGWIHARIGDRWPGVEKKFHGIMQFNDHTPNQDYTDWCKNAIRTAVVTRK